MDDSHTSCITQLAKLKPKTDLAISQLIRASRPLLFPSHSRSAFLYTGKRLQAQRGTAEPATDELIAGMDKAGADADEGQSDED